MRHLLPLLNSWESMGCALSAFSGSRKLGADPVSVGSANVPVSAPLSFSSRLFTWCRPASRTGKNAPDGQVGGAVLDSYLFFHLRKIISAQIGVMSKAVAMTTAAVAPRSTSEGTRFPWSPVSSLAAVVTAVLGLCVMSGRDEKSAEPPWMRWGWGTVSHAAVSLGDMGWGAVPRSSCGEGGASA